MSRDRIPEGIDPAHCKPLMTHCPHCGAPATRHWHPSSEWPKPGDFSLCDPCGRVSVYTNSIVGLTLRLPSPEEQAEIDTDEDVARARREFPRH